MPDSEFLALDGVRVGIGCAVLFAGTATGVAIGLSIGGFTVVLAVATGLCASTVDRRSGLLLGATGWGLCTGFGVNDFGELTFAPTDGLRVLGYVGCAVFLGRRRIPAQ